MDFIKPVIKKIKTDFDFAKRCKKLYDYHFEDRIRGKEVACDLKIDDIDGKKKPFFNMYVTLEDVGLHLRIKMDAGKNDFYGNIYTVLVEILKKKKTLTPDLDAAEIMILFFKACVEATKQHKKPFYISVKKLNGKHPKGKTTENKEVS